MKKIIHHKPPKHHYNADACVLWCFDDRFSSMLGSFKKKLKFKHIDLIKIAGGAKVLATRQKEFEEKYVLDQLEKSIRLHDAKRVVLMVHSECGAYGKHFKNEASEKKFYHAELKKAKRTVIRFFKAKKIKKPIEIYYADFSGLWRT